MAGNTPLGRAPTFHDIAIAEVAAINARRAALNSKAEREATDGSPDPKLLRALIADGDPQSKDNVLDVTALALSGGGIRSASVCLGVLQALNEYKCFPRIDYLSTVSGGGYIGTAVTASMAKNGGTFYFGESTGGTSGGHRADVKDTPAVGHLRNYSNYLMPGGARDVITALAIIARGLVANLAIVLGIGLMIAAGTILGSPTRRDLYVPNIFHWRVSQVFPWLGDTHFGITLVLSLFALVLFFAWAFYRSVERKWNKVEGDQSEIRTRLPKLFSAILVFIAVWFIFELQPFVLAGIFDLADQAGGSGSSDYSMLTAFIQWVAKIAAPVAAVVTYFREQIGTLFKSLTSSSRATTKMLAFTATAAIWVAGAALPLLIWIGYLYLCYWGIINDGRPDGQQLRRATEIHATVQVKGSGVDLKGTVDCGSKSQNPCAKEETPDTQVASPEHPRGDHTPGWLLAVATKVTEWLIQWPLIERLPKDFLDKLVARPFALFYFALGALISFLSLWLNSNANSLHRLYRDRLSKAFVFDPAKYADDDKQSAAPRDLAPLDTMKISELLQTTDDQITGPYHLINATLNVQGSTYANRRGRNSDFFLFSALSIGSEATGYARTPDVEKATKIDLPTAMSISGAAFSPNAGANSIRALTPTLALLNVRTGYWLKNPRFVARPEEKAKHRLFTFAYLLSEIIGTLYEDSSDVFISDGGHVENLGLYELLRRRCRIIIVVDAEADPAMRFGSLITVQRYARIDLGVRINLPWGELHEKTTAWMGFDGSTSTKDEQAKHEPSSGPHVAIGTIDYDGGKQGWIVYIKASLTGDENDYVRDYVRRYDAFPHESTGDQFFSEEQFEVYRALGFHITNRLLDGRDVAQVYDEKERWVHRNINEKHDNVDPVRAALLGR